VNISDLRKKLPLINSDNKKIRIVGYIVYAWIVLSIFGAIIPNDTTTSASADNDTKAGTVSVDVDGYTFTADLGDQWKTSSFSPESDTLYGYNSGKDWDGVNLANAFWLSKGFVWPVDVSGLADDPHQKDLIAVVSVSVHKIPKELQGESPHDILIDAYPLIDETVKDIEFNGHPALLVQSKHEGETGYGFIGYGYLSILMTNDTVVNVDVTEWPEVQTGIVSWDIMKKFTVSPK
jgi:hypothetical protein